MRDLKKLAWIGMAFLATAGLTAAAQNPDAAGAYGEIQLSGGFMLDPHTVRLDAGGDFDAEGLGNNCVGYINANAPDFVLNFRDPQQPLNIYVMSDADTTLVVRNPTGTWFCDDDTEGFNPMVRLVKPAAGRYAIWVGTFSSGQFAAADLYISELDPIWQTTSRDPSPDNLPSYGTFEIVPGFQPDPMIMDLQAGGPDDAAQGSTGCTGYINAEHPDFWLQLPRRLPELHVAAISDEDTTLIIATPDGSWLCNDDTHGLNPAVTLDGGAGRYAVWVGTYGSDPAPARLVVSASWIPWGKLASDFHAATTEPLVDIEGLNALDAFLKIAETVPDGGIQWESARPLGDDGFVLENIMIRPEPDSDEGIVQIERLVVNRLDLASAVRQQPPAFADLAVTGLQIPMEELAEEDWAAYLDVDTLSLDLALAYALDADAGTLQLDHLRLDLHGLAALETRFNVLGVKLEEVMGAWLTEDPTAVTSSLASLEMSYQDHGFLRAILTAVAAEESQTLAGLIERLVGEMRAQSLDLGLSRDPLAQAVMVASEKFLRDIPEGTGRLTLRLAPARPVDPLTALLLLADPGQAASRLGLSVDYTAR